MEEPKTKRRKAIKNLNLEIMLDLPNEALYGICEQMDDKTLYDKFI